MEIIAHRGASFDAPENTLAAVRAAWGQRADAVEADFQLTADGQLVALHDDDLWRTAGVRARVGEKTLAELQGLDVGRWKGARWRGEPIATLAQMLATIPPGKRFLIEIKAAEAAVPELCRVVRAASCAAAQIVIISLDGKTCAAAKRALPDCAVYWVVDFAFDPATNCWTPSGEAMIADALAAGLDGLDLQGSGPIDAALIAAIRAAGLALCVWTIDDPNLARRLLELGVQGITTNRPGWLRQQLNRGN
ncbi:MAG TPA: glycerophosphodiester phosphodiesterase family protein [Pirellulales bacterium]|nr:glycerophosphodiester phosphodiesterase family protein [Pirellulales bacterium]